MKKFRPAILGILILLTGVLGGGAAQAATFRGKDRKAPTTPTNFRVTGLTPGSVTFAWNPSTDNSGVFKYVIVSGALGVWEVPQTQTSATIRPQSIPYTWMAYDFYMYAIDASGNRSRNSNTVSVRFPTDVTPPDAPSVSLTSVGPTHIGISYIAEDDGLSLRYEINVNGSIWYSFRAETTATLYLLSPGQTYSIRVRARDGGGNWSEYSEPHVVTTPLPDPNDKTPPTQPPGLHDNGGPFQDGETWFFWDPSTDNFTPKNLIRYDLFVNGVYDGSTVEIRRFITYLQLGIVNTVEIYAIDEAGNRSSPVVLTYDLR